jgi:serine/threonine protein kinase
VDWKLAVWADYLLGEVSLERPKNYVSMSAILERGDKLENGHYTVIREIGVGGMGVVYHCRDELLLRDVAIKMLLPELMTDSASHDVFRQEARLAAQLEHPNVVTIYDIGIEAKRGRDHHYVAMEYLPGGNLASRLLEGPLPVEHCLNWMKQLASGLSFAHKRKVVHQDIKADNIFITNEGDLKIGDFGLARLLVGRVHYNAANRGMGTPAYMSPELCRGEPQDYRSDIYSLGVLYFEMATGQLPFEARGMIEMAMKHSNAPIPSVRRLNPQVPEVLEQMIRKMMLKNPQERYQTTSEILTILDELIFELRVARLGLRTSRQISRSQPIVPPPAVMPGQDEKAGEAPASSEGSQKAIADSGQRKLSKAVRAKLAAFQSAQGLAALDLRWTFKSNGPIGWSSAPISDKDERFLYVASSDACVYALDINSGAKLWAHKTAGPIISSPLLINDKIAVASLNGDVSLISAKDGSLIWTFKTKRKIGTVPSFQKDCLIVPSLEGTVHAIDIKRGELKWEYQGDEAIAGSPQPFSDWVFVGTTAGGFLPLGLEDGQPAWRFQADGAIVAGSAVSVDSVYFGTKNGEFYALEAQTGRLVWEFSTNKPITSKSVIFFTSIIFSSHNQILYCCEKYGGELVWKADVKGTMLANVIVSGHSALTVTREGWLQCFSASSGKVKWQRELGRCVEATPLITSQNLFVPTVEGDVLAYSFSEAGLSSEQSLSA